MDLNNPSLEDIRRVFTLLTSYLKSKTVAISDKHKEERRRFFPKGTRLNRLMEYFKQSLESTMALQNSIMQLQQEQNNILTSLGLTQAKIAKYGPQLAPFMQELILNTDISLEQVRESLQIKTEFLQVHGQQLFTQLVELSASLSLQEKQFIPIFLNTIISDECFENEPNLDREEFDIATGTAPSMQRSIGMNLERN